MRGSVIPSRNPSTLLIARVRVLVIVVIGPGSRRRLCDALVPRPALGHHLPPGPRRRTVPIAIQSWSFPGLMGTSLKDRNTGEYLWGGFHGLSGDPRDVEVLRGMALPFDQPSSQMTSQDSLVPDRVLERARVRLFGLPLNLEVYAGILQVLGAGGYRDENLGVAGVVDYGPGHYTCFQFPYDWRRDLVESAQRLKAFLDEKRASVRAAYREQYREDRTRAQVRHRYPLHGRAVGSLLSHVWGPEIAGGWLLTGIELGRSRVRRTGRIGGDSQRGVSSRSTQPKLMGCP